MLHARSPHGDLITSNQCHFRRGSPGGMLRLAGDLLCGHAFVFRSTAGQVRLVVVAEALPGCCRLAQVQLNFAPCPAAASEYFPDGAMRLSQLARRIAPDGDR